MCRQDDAKRVMMCNALQFWRVCDERACRRRHTCSGDPQACFTRHWSQFPEDGKVWLRAGIKARVDGLSPQAAARAADAEVARHVALMAKHARPAAAAAPAPHPDEAAIQETVDDDARTGPRVRSL
jgi:hypothetical protein